MSDRPRTGLRREAALFMPAALIVLVALSVVTVLLYRGAIQRQIEIERRATSAIARRVVDAVRASPGTDLGRLQAGLASNTSIALLDASGRVIAGEEDLIPTGSIPQQGSLPPDQAETFGPGGEAGNAIVALAPIGRGFAASTVRVTRALPHLAAEAQRLRILVPLVLAVNAILTLLVLAFFRHSLRPYGEMLEKARIAGVESSDRDEVAFLIETFDRAVSALSAPVELDESTQLRALRETLGEGAGGALLLVGTEGELLAASPAAERLIGARLDLGTPVFEALDTQPELAHTVRLALDQGSSMPTAEVRLQQGEEDRIVGLTVQLLRRPDGSTRGYLVLFADLTDVRRKADQERLAESLAQLGELSAGVAHELRNSLGTLSGYLELIERHRDEPPAAEYLAPLRTEYLHLERVVNDFLAFARPGTARPEAVDLVLLVRELLTAPAFADHPVDTRLPAAAPIHADPLLVSRALHNILANAGDAHPNDSLEPIELGLEEQGSNWRLTIADRGPGLPEDVRRRLFQPFVTGRARGIGLGLSLAHRIIELHRGRLQLLERDGGGTTAEIILPSGKTE